MLAVDVDRVRAARKQLADHPAVRLAAVFGDALHVTVGSAERDGPAVRDALTDAGFSVGEVQRISPNMEDVFIHRIAGAERLGGREGASPEKEAL